MNHRSDSPTKRNSSQLVQTQPHRFLMITVAMALIISILPWLPQPLSVLAAKPQVFEQIALGAQGKLAVVFAQNATLHDTPGGRILQTLAPGATLAAYGRTGDSKWVVVRTDANVTGWILTEQLVIFGVEDLPIMSDAPATPSTRSTPWATPWATPQVTPAAIS